MRVPHFLVLGTQKGGTTFLYHLLCQHPRIMSAKRKEIHFFDFHYEKGTGWYRRQFPPAWKLRHRITGEVSPLYLFHPLAPARIAQTLPHASLIACLRNPIHRAWSQYHMLKQRGIESRSFEDAIHDEMAWIAENGMHPTHADLQAFKPYQETFYLLRGIYIQQLQAYEGVHVIESERLFTQPNATLNQLFSRLGLSPYEINPLVPRNTGTYQAQMPQAIYKELTDFFAPYNQALSTYLGQQFSWS